MHSKQQQESEHSISLNFKNPICQQTFKSLPRIYGSIKKRIINNKLQFYEQLQQQPFPEYSRSKQKQQKSSAIRRSVKKQYKNSPSHHVVQNTKQSRSKTNKKMVAYFSDKYSKLNPSKKTKITRALRIKTDDHQSDHKVKFNTLNFMLPTIRSTPQKPQTLSEILQEKLSKSVSLNNPLQHLYKSKKNLNNYHKFQIKQQNNQDDSRKNSSNQYYIPRQIRASMHNKKPQPLLSLNAKKHQRHKTQASQKQSYRSNKLTSVQTEFSKRIATQSPGSKQKNLRDQGHQLIQKTSTKFHIPRKHQYKSFIEEYKPVHDNFNFRQLIQKDDFQIITYDNGVYFGEYSHQKSGLGVMVTQNWIFQGLFSKDHKSKGAQITYDGIYKGEFDRNLRSGKGTFQWNNGQLYEGEWLEGKKHGRGSWKSPSGDHYQGQWYNGRQQGQGVHYHKNSTYKGQFLNSLKHGYGQEQFKNGDVYKGMYEKGKPHGIGQYTWNDGTYYQGEFSRGYRDGKGTLNEYNGSCYKAKVVSREISSTVSVNKHQRTAKSTKAPFRMDTQQLMSKNRNIDDFIQDLTEIMQGGDQRTKTFQTNHIQYFHCCFYPISQTKVPPNLNLSVTPTASTSNLTQKAI